MQYAVHEYSCQNIETESDQASTSNHQFTGNFGEERHIKCHCGYTSSKRLSGKFCGTNYLVSSTNKDRVIKKQIGGPVD